MNCPKCSEAMETLIYKGVTVEKCVGCKGIWVDLIEEARLLKTKNSQIIDDGDRAVGKEMNLKEDINCPVCGMKMIKMADVNQPHIWYEKCPHHGVYFDAGEFRDLKEENISDIVKDMLIMFKGGRKI